MGQCLVLWFTLLCSETRKRSSSSSWLLAAAGSRDEAQSGGSGGRDVVDPGAHTDLRASSLIAFHRDGFCEENQKRSKRLKKIILRRLFNFSQWIVFNGSVTGRRLLDDWNCWKFGSTARFPRARKLVRLQVTSTPLPAGTLLPNFQPKIQHNVDTACLIKSSLNDWCATKIRFPFHTAGI